MKKIDTEFINSKKASIDEINLIIDELFEVDSEEWLCLYDTSKNNPNYIQIHSDIEDFEDDAAQYIVNILGYNSEKIDSLEQMYLIEFRKYNGEEFTHYRAFFDDKSRIKNYFEKYMNDEDIDTSNWLDVTEEFIEE